MSIKKSVLNFLGLGGGEGQSNVPGQPASVEAFLSDLGAFMGYDIEFDKQIQEDGTIVFNVKGPEVESFLGGSTEILDSLGHLSMRIQRRVQGMANTPTGENDELTRIRFDSEGFRDRRRVELIDIAKKLRQKVLDSGKAAYINALSPGDRKVIHTTISELGADIVTESIGKGHYKRIRVKFAHVARPQGDRPPRGPRPGGRGPGGPRRFDRNDNRNGQVVGEDYGNRDNAAVVEEEVVDENIGNRLAPGEESPYFKG